MYFSCKISNAIVSDLEHRGEDLSALYDPAFPHMEVLRDPTAWLSAPEMEAFLETLVGMNWAKVDGSILTEAGHAGPKNRAWGVLDSVLRMMPRPQEIFHQPERFLSYFISPEPPIENLIRSEDRLSFDLPLPTEQYPHVTAYLRSAFEALPLYTGQQLAKCVWQDIKLEIIWPQAPENMFIKDPGHQISPELLESVIADHQRLLRELEDKNREIQRREEELISLRRAPLTEDELPDQAISELQIDGVTPAHVIGQNLARLHDYMVRAQQLITLFAGMNKKDPSVKEALRRLDWDHVKTQYPRAIAESVDSLRRIQTRPQPTTRLEEQPHV